MQFDELKRREFKSLLGGAAATWALAARAQQPASTVRRIGFLLPGGPRTTVVRGQLEAFHQELKEYGWSEGQNISVEYRFAEGKEDALAGIAAELVRLRGSSCNGVVSRFLGARRSKSREGTPSRRPQAATWR